EKTKRALDRPLDVRTLVERSPERMLGAEIAAAEERPAHASLVVLRLRERYRRQEHEALVAKRPGAPSEVGRPIRVLSELGPRYPAGRTGFDEVLHRIDRVACDVQQPVLE